MKNFRAWRRHVLSSVAQVAAHLREPDDDFLPVLLTCGRGEVGVRSLSEDTLRDPQKLFSAILGAFQGCHADYAAVVLPILYQMVPMNVPGADDEVERVRRAGVSNTEGHREGVLVCLASARSHAETYNCEVTRHDGRPPTVGQPKLVNNPMADSAAAPVGRLLAAAFRIAGVTPHE